ncbi:2,3-bisphosphoglycerate-independent phosphoglycerate mutase, partial [Dictyocoela roeselum]
GVHGHIDHIKSLLRNLRDRYDEIYVHAIADGRDVDEKSILRYADDMSRFMVEMGKGDFGSISGRYYSMDRDMNWCRTELSYEMMVGQGKIYCDQEYGALHQEKYVNGTDKEDCDLVEEKEKHKEYIERQTPKADPSKEWRPINYRRLVNAVNHSYRENKTDEFIKPVLLSRNAVINHGDTVIFTNYRADRMRQLAKTFLDKKYDIITMTEYDKTLSEIYTDDLKCGGMVRVIFTRPKIANTLGEVVSKAGLTQVRIAESEKYAHVTYFLNGGSESEFVNEKRIVVPSPQVRDFSETPEMNIQGVVENIIRVTTNDNSQDTNMRNDRNLLYKEPNKTDLTKHLLPDLVIANLAAPDMVGHTGKFNETCAAVQATDEAIGLIYECCLINGYKLVITADHGNAECMERDGEVVKKHTTNKVPLIICNEKRDTHSEEGWGFIEGDFSLIDVAPTVLGLLGIEKPEEMEGNDLLKK